MAEMARIKSSPQTWRARGLINSGLTGQKRLKFDWCIVIDVEYGILVDFIFIFIWSTYVLLKPAQIRSAAS